MEYKLRDLYKVSNGLSKGGSFFGSGFPFISFSTVFNNFFVPEEINDFVQSTLKEQVTYSIKKGDILITRTSETIDELGMSCVALKDYPTATFNGFCKRLRPLTDKVYPHFIGYYLRTPYFRSNFTKVASLITRASLRNEDLLRFSIELPPIYKQKKIAEILYSYDNLIENNNKRIKLLEQMAENLYKEWFVRFRFPGYEDVEFENGIPKGWEIESLSDIADIIMGQSPESENYNTNCIGLPFHQGVGSYGDFYLIDGVYSTKGNRIAEANSIIFSVRAPVGRINITLNKIILGRGVAGINSVKGYNAYLLWMLKNRFQQEDIIGNGSIFASVTKKELFGFKMFMPNEDLIQKFDSIASGIESVMRNISLINSNLKKQRDMLLPRLMSGKLEV